MARRPAAPPDLSHGQLIYLAEKWLWRQNCGIVFRDPFRPAVSNGELPDAIGWRQRISILVECKATRADFHADALKSFRASPAKGVGDWRFYLCPTGVIRPEEVPAGWGLLYAGNQRVTTVIGLPSRIGWDVDPPFRANKCAELEMMYVALRRFVVRGHLGVIYLPAGQGNVLPSATGPDLVQFPISSEEKQETA